MVKIEKPLSAQCDRFHNLRATMKQNRGLWENMACMISTGWSNRRKTNKMLCNCSLSFIKDVPL